MKIQKILYLLFFFWFYSIHIFAQDSNFLPEYRVSQKDLITNIYTQDSLATALVIYESGNSYISELDYTVITKYKKKVKILKSEGLDYATFKIYLYKKGARIEKIRDIKATSYNYTKNEVEVVQLSKANIFEEKISDQYRTVTFTLPNVRKGSVFTCSYTLESPFIYNFYDWDFQEDIPKIYSEYTTKIPANYNYNIKLVGHKKLDKNEIDIERECFTYGTASADCTLSYYVMKDIPAFVEEDYMTTKENYLSKIEYELMQIKYFDGRVDNITQKWKDADYEIKTTSLGKELRKSSSVDGLISEKLSTETDPLNKAKGIFEYVQKNYVWDEDYHLFTEISVKKIIKNKSGNIGSLNCLLYNLLKSNGIEVFPVLSSTRENGLPTKLFPVLSEFNYLLVKAIIGGKEYLLDASDKYVSFGQLPFRCLNSYGRKLDFKNGSEWVSIESKTGSMSYMSLDLKFIDSSFVKGTMNTGYSGYHALNRKKKYFPNPETYKNNLEEELDGFDIETYLLKSARPTDLRFQEVIELKKEFDIQSGIGIYLDPFFYKFFTQNPFKLQKRTYPVDFGYKDSYLYKLKLDVGDHYEIGDLPKNIRIGLPEKKGDVQCSFSTTGTCLNVSFKINFKEARYEPYFYEGLKEIMKSAVNTQLNSIVVLNKK